jgi:hypothetical protein
MAASVATVAAQAGVLLDVTAALQVTDPTQLGRLSRNNIQQDWAGSESYPGVVNGGTTYHYTTYSVNVGISNYIQIDFDDIAGLSRTFVSAYQTSYDSTNLATNWLGDAGASGNFFGTDPRFFNVVVGLSSDLIIVVNNTNTSNGGVGDQYHLMVEGWIDADYTEAPTESSAPEPSAVYLCFAGLAALAGRRAWKRS